MNKPIIVYGKLRKLTDQAGVTSIAEFKSDNFIGFVEARKHDDIDAPRLLACEVELSLAVGEELFGNRSNFKITIEEYDG